MPLARRVIRVIPTSVSSLAALGMTWGARDTKLGMTRCASDRHDPYPARFSPRKLSTVFTKKLIPNGIAMSLKS